MPRALVLGLGLAVVAFVAALALFGGEEPGLGEPAKGPAAEAGNGPAAGASPTSGAMPVAGADARAEGHRVWLEWSRVQALALAGPAVHVLRSGQPIEAAVDVLARTPAAGDAFAGAAVLRVREGGREVCRRVTATAQGEFVVDLGIERALEGRIVDGKGAPIEGAAVWYGGPLEQIAHTDADGRFAVTAFAGAGVPVVVQKDGRATTSAFVDVDATNGARIDLVLGDGAALVVQAAGAAATLRDARIVLVPPESTTTASDAFPFWAQDLFLSLELDTDGRVRCDGLPAGTQIGIALVGPCVPRTAPIDFVVRAGGEPVVFPATEAARVRGVVVDERGEPSADVEVAIRPANARGEASGLMPAAVPLRGEARGRTGGDGTFELAIPSAREAFVVRARANGIDGTLRVEAGGEAALRLVLPRRLEGRAQFEVRPPVAGVAWAIRVDPWTDGRFVELVGDAAYEHRVDAPFAGDLRVRTADGTAWSAPREHRGLVVDGAFVLPPELLR